MNHIIFVFLNQTCMTLNVDNDDFLKVDWKILEIMSDRILCFISDNLLSVFYL